MHQRIDSGRKWAVIEPLLEHAPTQLAIENDVEIRSTTQLILDPHSDAICRRSAWEVLDSFDLPRPLGRVVRGWRRWTKVIGGWHHKGFPETIGRTGRILTLPQARPLRYDTVPARRTVVVRFRRVDR